MLVKLKNLKQEDVKMVEVVQVPDEDTEGARVDLNQLYRVAGDDESFVIEMLEKFIESFEAGYDVMVDGIDKGELKIIGDAAHKLASPCRHIGAEALLAILKEIELESENEKTELDMKKRAEEAQKEYGLIKELILDHINNRNN